MPNYALLNELVKKFYNFIKHMTSKAINIPTYQERAFWGMATLVFLLALGYGLLVRQTVLAAVDLQRTEEKIATTNSIVSNLESTYFSLTNTLVTLDKAKEMGLVTVAPSATYYIARTTSPFSFNSRP